ncbi:MAG: hypothetical protein VXZ82_18365 [Planctomycetota bacterium]|nr:hypothetical protein [Planctomycetota bacterium]
MRQLQDAPTEHPYSFILTTEVDETFHPQSAGGINCGSYPRGDDGGSESPVIVREVESTEQRTKDVEAAGGSLFIWPAENPGMRIYAQINYSEGNTIRMWQPLNG